MQVPMQSNVFWSIVIARSSLIYYIKPKVLNTSKHCSMSAWDFQETTLACAIL